MLDQITHLFRLRTILEEGSLRRAAERLNLTQPALSRSLAQLEAHFGQPLVDRHARGVVATPFGERVLTVSNRISRYWEIAELELTADAFDKRSRIRIGAGPVWRAGILSDVFAEMQRLFPRLVIEVTPLVFGSTLDELREGRIDVAFSGVALDEDDSRQLESHFLTNVTNQIMVRENHPLFDTVEDDGSIRDVSLLEYPWIIYSDMPIYRETTQHAIYERLGREPEIRFVCSNLLSALSMLQTSDSLCLLPDLSVISANAPRIVPLPVKLSLRRAQTGIIYRRELRDWEPVQALVELCKAKFNQ